jgi:hypothetical protein
MLVLEKRFYIITMERRYLNQAGGSSFQPTRQEGIASKEVKISSQTKKSRDFVRLEREGTHKEHRSDHMSEAEPSHSIAASQGQQVHEVGLIDYSQESHHHLIKEKLEENIAKHFKNLIENFKKIEIEVNSIQLRDEFLLYKQEMGKLHWKLACSLNEADLYGADKCVKECESRKKEFEAYLKEQKWLRDTSIEEFENAFKTKISKSRNSGFLVESTAKRGSGFYQNRIDLEKGQIIGIHNKKHFTKNWHLSDVVYNQLQLVLKKAGKDISQFDLKSWYGKNIINENTGHIAEILLGEIQQKTFKIGSNEFNAIKRTATAKSKFYLLEQHSEAFRGKQVTSITVIRNNEGEIDIDYAISDHLSD